MFAFYLATRNKSKRAHGMSTLSATPASATPAATPTAAPNGARRPAPGPHPGAALGPSHARGGRGLPRLRRGPRRIRPPQPRRLAPQPPSALQSRRP